MDGTSLRQILPRGFKVDGGPILYLGITALTAAVGTHSSYRRNHICLIFLSTYGYLATNYKYYFFLEPLRLKLLYRFFVYSLAFDQQSFLPATLEEPSEPIPRGQ
jgi:hypothetical protein